MCFHFALKALHLLWKKFNVSLIYLLQSESSTVLFQMWTVRHHYEKLSLKYWTNHRNHRAISLELTVNLICILLSQIDFTEMAFAYCHYSLLACLWEFTYSKYVSISLFRVKWCSKFLYSSHFYCLSFDITRRV